MSVSDNEHPTVPKLPTDEPGAATEATASRLGNSGGAPRPPPAVPRPSGPMIGKPLPPAPPPSPLLSPLPLPPPPPPSSPGTGSPLPLPLPPPPLRQTPVVVQDDGDAEDRETLPGSVRPPYGRESEASIEIPPPAELVPAGSNDPYIGTTFDHRYKIERLLGEGGMGFVYLARHKVIDKKVAVKVLRPELAKDVEIFERFVQEARAASSIGNPHIVDVSDFGDLPDGSKYFVMEYLEGVSLSNIIDSPAAISIDRICHIATQLSAGLAAAHTAGIIHRDLKPDNVFVVHRGTDPDFVKILDFGIAKVSTDPTARLTRAGAVFGTPHYMSPEQAAGAPIDHRADIYSLGVMLYELVSRQLPFNADNFMGILTQHMYKAPVPIRALVGAPDCPPSLEAVILKCLSKKPEGRYQTMDELNADLQVVRSGGVPGAVAEMMARSGGFNVPHDYFKPKPAIVPATPPPAKRGPWPRYVWIAGAAAAVGIVTAIFVISGSSNGHEQGLPAAPQPTVETAASTAPAAIKKKTVMVVGYPDGAAAYRDGTKIVLPSPFEIEEGQTITLEIRAEGHVSQTITLDGAESVKTVKLDKEEVVKPPSRPVIGRQPPSPRGTGTKKSGEVVDPWAPRNRNR